MRRFHFREMILNVRAVDSEMEGITSEICRESCAALQFILSTLTFAVMSIAWKEPDLTESSHPSWKAPAEGYGLSIVMHGVLLALLSIFTIVDSPFSGNHDLMVNWNTNSLQDALEPDPVQPQEYQPQSGGSQPASVAFLAPAEEEDISAPEVRDADLLAVTSNETFSTSQMAEYVGILSSFGLDGDGDGDGSGDGQGSGFFGKPGSASSFVFVLDRSGSMNHRHIYSGNLTRFQRLKMELIRFIDRLKPHQKFYVIFFDERPLRMPANHLVEATEANKQAFFKWLATVKAGGSTDPRGAIKQAMSLKPDQIYFLSDGEIMEVYRARMMALPAGEWKLNTYAFGEGSERFMRVFADKHKGKFIYIP